MEQDRGTALQWIKADGGLTHSRPAMTMIAALLQTEVRIDKRRQASALGVALLACIGKGILTFSEVKSLAQKAPYDTYHPAHLDKNLESAYDLWNQRVRYKKQTE
jgi:glycerol kinase